MKVVIAGGTGFVGENLTKELERQGHTIYILTRSPERYSDTNSVKYIKWLTEDSQPEVELPPIDAVVNLAGDSLFGYWTRSKKQRILTSRLQATEQVIALIKNMDPKPEVLINASAVGYYGISKTKTFTEKTIDAGDDFLAHVTKQWEEKAKPAEHFGVRTVFARFGIILGQEGSLPLMTLPFKFMLGGKVGSGEQWMSWIHINDAVGLLLFAIHTPKLNGPLNVTAPKPVNNQSFSKKLAKALHRPYWLPAPSFMLKTLLGEMSILVVEGQAVLPEKATTYRYTFQFPNLDHALSSIFTKEN